MLPPPVRPCATPLLLAAHGWAMPMVPCPECEVPQYRQKEPKAGAERYPCKECAAKRRQRKQREQQLRKACREKECVVTCGRPGCGKEIALQRAPRRSTTSHVCGGCLAKEAVAAAAAICTECDEPFLRLTQGRGSHKQKRCPDCRGVARLYECPRCEQPCDPIEAKAGKEMYAKCAQCAHETGPGVVCGDLYDLQRTY